MSSSDMINIGVIGFGYWGPNVARNFSQIDDAQVSYICDLDEERLARARRQYPHAQMTRNLDVMLADPSLDLVAIATPVSTHHKLAIRALNADKHILVEKPLTTRVEHARDINATARARGRRVFVDHSFIFTPAVRKMKEICAAGELGNPLYYDSTRVNLGIFQHDVNVIWDLAVHDLSIMDHLLKARPRAVSATGMTHVAGGHENIAYLTLFFDNRFIAHIHVNWLAPVKVRRTLIGGSQRMIVYDDLEPSEKIKIYDRGITVNSHPDNVYEMLVGYRAGDMWAPRLESAEALKTEVAHFVSCIEGRTAPLTDGASGLRVVRLVEAASASMNDRGKLIEL